MPKCLIKFLLGYVVLYLSAFVPVLAEAQTDTTAGSITVVTNSQSTQLMDASLQSVNRPYVPDKPFWVNRQECEADWQYQIGLSTTNLNTFLVEVWASNGGDCTSTISRFSTPVCWKVWSEGSFVQGTAGTRTIYIPARTIVRGRKAGDDQTIIHDGTADDCDPNKRQDKPPSAGVSITLYIMAWTNGSSGDPTVKTTWGDAGFDLMGPSAPDPESISVASADTQLYMNWSQVLDADLAGYHLYCEKSPGSGSDASVASTGGSAATGGASGTAGSDTASDAGPTVDPQCAGSVLQEGLTPPAGVGYRGKVGDKLSTSGLASGLQNGFDYACAISAYDTRENDGPLSKVICGKPWWVKDFFSAYRKEGGQGGGGFCRIGQKSSGFGLLIPLASLGVLALRRGRRLATRSKRMSARHGKSD